MEDKKIVLRDYQQEAVEKILWSLTLEGNSLVVLPTGSGKSVVIAALAHRLNKPILIIQPTKEILEQNMDKLKRYIDPSEIGVYSASMGEKTIKKYTFATIGSIYRKAEEFRHFGLIIIDECHLVNPKNLDGMFTTFLRAIGSPAVVGLTATPYRMDLAYRYEYGSLMAYTTIQLINRKKHHFWARLVYNINTEDLLRMGYLCPIEYIDRSLIKHEDIPTNKSQSDFDLEAFEKKISGKEREIIDAIALGRETSRSVLVFCSSVRQAEHLKDVFGDESAVVTAKTSKKDRENIIDDFRSGKIPVVFNVGVFSIGFDYPELDCIVLARPTRSIALYYQLLGRGIRTALGKECCRVIDLTSTVSNLGRIETIKLEKIDGKWELNSETGSWHNAELYHFKVK